MMEGGQSSWGFKNAAKAIGRMLPSRKGCMTTGLVATSIVVGGGLYGIYQDSQPVWSPCYEVKSDGIAAALKNAGQLYNFPVQVQKPLESGYVDKSQIDTLDDLLNPGLLERDYAFVPNGTMVCVDSNPNSINHRPTPTPSSDGTSQPMRPKGRNGHLVGTKPMGRINRVVYSGSGRR